MHRGAALSASCCPPSSFFFLHLAWTRLRDTWETSHCHRSEDQTTSHTHTHTHTAVVRSTNTAGVCPKKATLPFTRNAGSQNNGDGCSPPFHSQYPLHLHFTVNQLEDICLQICIIYIFHSFLQCVFELATHSFLYPPKTGLSSHRLATGGGAHGAGRLSQSCNAKSEADLHHYIIHMNGEQCIIYEETSHLICHVRAKLCAKLDDGDNFREQLYSYFPLFLGNMK